MQVELKTFVYYNLETYTVFHMTVDESQTLTQTRLGDIDLQEVVVGTQVPRVLDPKGALETYLQVGS